MAWRFRKSLRLAKGIRLNLGKRGASVRVGGRNVGITEGTSGARISASVPGTGLGVTHKIGSGGRSRGGGSDTAWGCLAVVVILFAIYIIGRFV